jgi:hypothetical protein
MLHSFRPAWISALFLFFLLGPAGCAEIASGPQGTSLDALGRPSPEAARAAPLRVSAGEIGTMSSQYFGEIEFTFENPSGKWIRVEQVALDFGSEQNNQAVHFPWGTQLKSWADATSQRNAIQDANDAKMLLGAGGACALVLAAAQRGADGLRVLGGTASPGAITTMLATNVEAESGAADSAPRFGGDHLFAGPFDVPPGLFVKRWLVINTPDQPALNCLTSVTMTYALADKTSHRVALAFRLIGSQWQQNVCPHEENLERQP